MNILLAELPALLVLTATCLLLWGERRVHSYNYAYLKAVEGEELIPRLMDSFQAWTCFMPWIAFLTSYLLPSSLKFAPSPFFGLTLIVVAVVLKISSMRSLGRLWSLRCVFIPGMPRVNHGPYRFMRHPEYVGRMLEGLGLSCFFGLNPLATIALFYGLSLLPKIIKTESRQLYELSVAPLQLPQRSSTVGTSE